MSGAAGRASPATRTEATEPGRSDGLAPPRDVAYNPRMLRWIVDRVLKKNPPLLAVGAPAPAFEVPDHYGETVRSADLAGKRFVLWFYQKAGTPG